MNEFDITELNRKPFGSDWKTKESQEAMIKLMGINKRLLSSIMNEINKFYCKNGNIDHE